MLRGVYSLDYVHSIVLIDCSPRRYYEEIGARRSIDVTVVDRCVGCQEYDIDVSTGVFDQLAARADGRVTVTWAWLSD